MSQENKASLQPLYATRSTQSWTASIVYICILLVLCLALTSVCVGKSRLEALLNRMDKDKSEKAELESVLQSQALVEKGLQWVLVFLLLPFLFGLIMYTMRKLNMPGFKQSTENLYTVSDQSFEEQEKHKRHSDALIETAFQDGRPVYFKTEDTLLSWGMPINFAMSTTKICALQKTRTKIEAPNSILL